MAYPQTTQAAPVAAETQAAEAKAETKAEAKSDAPAESKATSEQKAKAEETKPAAEQEQAAAPEPEPTPEPEAVPSATSEKVDSNDQKADDSNAAKEAATPSKSDSSKADSSKDTAPAEKENKPATKAEEKANKDTKSADEAAKTSPAFNQTKTINGVKITVKAEKGVLPEGATLAVKTVPQADQKRVDLAINAVRADEAHVAAAYTFDISILDADGKEVQPANNAKVQVTFETEEVSNPNLATQVYHIDNNKAITAKTVEELKTETEGKDAVVKTSGFSYYTVEFTYNNLQYVMEGDTTIDLADILKTVDLQGEPTAVETSNTDLFSAAKDGKTWKVTAHKAFTSTEWMKVTIGDVVYEIVVTDAIPGSVVTGQVDMNNGETKTGDFTITGGPVRGPQNGSATIKDGTITNQATNNAKGGVGGSAGSALISRKNLNLDGVTINTTTKSLVLNIWENASVTANNTVLDGQTTDYGDLPFLLIGTPSGGVGTLNFTGDSAIKNTKGVIAGGNNNSKINVNSGTLTISGSDITPQNGTQIVVKSGATLTIENSTIDLSQNGRIRWIVLEDGAALNLNNTTITGSPNLGVVRAKGNNTINIDGSTFENNTANGQSPQDNGGVLLVENGSEVTVTNSTFKNNKAAKGGGAIWQKGGTLTIEGSTFENNTAQNQNGGAVYFEGDEITVGDGNTFTGNTADKGYGGAVYSKTVTTVGASTFDGNSAKQGGGVYITTGGASSVEGATFKNNKANESADGGGAICVGLDGSSVGADSFTVTDTTFENNTASRGGALRLKEVGDTTITGSTFTENKGEDSQRPADAGAISHVNGNLTIEDTTFTGNTATGHAGALKTETSGTVTINKSTFKDNVVAGDGNSTLAGAAYIQGASKTTITESEFDNNAAASASSYSQGGALYLTKTDAAINGSKFTNNLAQTYGGAICMAANDNGATAVIGDSNGTPSEFTGNEVVDAGDFAGGAICIHNGSAVSMKDAAVYNNYADDAGAGIANCQIGASEVRVYEGAAIFNNTVGGSSNLPEATSLSDVYFFTPEGNYDSELHERMFNGGLHMWDSKVTQVDYEVSYGNGGEVLIGKSNPTNTDTSGAKVIFTENKAYRGESETGVGIASGGAISCNGSLEIGSLAELKILKVWDDADNVDGVRPSLEDYKAAIDSGKLRLLANGTPVDLTADPIKVDVVQLTENVSVTDDIVEDPNSEARKKRETIAQEQAANTYVIIVSGIEKVDGEGNPITYTIEGDEIPGYTVKEVDTEANIITNHHTPNAKASIAAKKVMWDGSTVPSEHFEFTIQPMDNPADDPITEATAVRNDDAGNIDFGTYSYVVPTSGSTTYTYVIYESNVPAAYRADGLAYVVTVTVNADGKATVAYSTENGEPPVFENYQDTHPNSVDTRTPVALTGMKTIDGGKPGNATFTFQIDKVSENAPGTFPVTATNDASGTITFPSDAFTFGKADIGNTYHYTIKEVNDGQEGYTYDTTTYDLYMSVYQKADAGQIDGEIWVNYYIQANGNDAEAIAFDNQTITTSEKTTPKTNTPAKKTPAPKKAKVRSTARTGDAFDPALLSLVVLTSSLMLAGAVRRRHNH